MAVVTAVLVIGAAGCSGDRPRSAASPTRSPVFTSRDFLATTPPLTLPAGTCQVFARAVSTHDATTDRGPGDAFLRARRYMTAGVDRPDATDRLPAALWAQWVAHRVTTQVLVVADPNPQPPDTTAVAHRSAAVFVTPVGRDGWRGPVIPSQVLCQLVRAGAEWRVTAYRRT